ncbi:hypothetical protein FN846DRAFT_934954 [Sphaerosporella brunnea]|uniref:Uncharacterized protein n=1 Tax=Sphaerosporella brunnea TaxID=1250544 RepID=A0A5J5F5R6_9PEZI|nr:hypothetical protein FN846DRAFT_934954 [Sphaerosporella brunnea]
METRAANSEALLQQLSITHEPCPRNVCCKPTVMVEQHQRPPVAAAPAPNFSVAKKVLSERSISHSPRGLSLILQASVAQLSSSCWPDSAYLLRLATMLHDLKELWFARYVDLPPYRWVQRRRGGIQTRSSMLGRLESNPGGGAAAQDPIRLQSCAGTAFSRAVVDNLHDGCRGPWAPTHSHYCHHSKSSSSNAATSPRKSISGFASTAIERAIESPKLHQLFYPRVDWLSPLLLSPICSSSSGICTHCRSCDLSFSQHSSIPTATISQFDGRYFASIGSHNDAKPTYSTPAPLSAVPLISAAPDLPRMRELSLHCILDDLDGENVRESVIIPAATALPQTSAKSKRETHNPAAVRFVFEEENQTYRGLCDEMHFDEEDFVQWACVARTTRGRRGGRGRDEAGSHAGRKSWISSSDEEAEDED